MDVKLRERLGRRARQLGKTDSELVREILENALAERRLETRAGHLMGRLSLKRASGDPWRKELRARNWRR
ncbi:MAG: hypothetical protein HY652_12165 [Acidobacteria bacterium]|nr:hypothetical protein [Acidobacteriota bacterium]